MTTALLTRCKDSAPLVVLEGRPFNGLEIRPADLRAMAQQLLAVADMATKLPTGGKHWKPTQITLGAVVPRQTAIAGAAIESRRIARQQAQLDRLGRHEQLGFPRNKDLADADAPCADDLLALLLKSLGNVNVSNSCKAACLNVMEKAEKDVLIKLLVDQAKTIADDVVKQAKGNSNE